MLYTVDNFYVRGDKMKTYNEAYVFKKPRTLLTIENEIRKIKNKWDDKIDPKTGSTINKEDKPKLIKDLRSLCKITYRELVKEFNFGKKFDFLVEIDNIVNAWSSDFTYKNIELSNYKNIIEISPDKRMRFKNRDICNATVTFTTAIIFNKEMKADYLVAIMLHEIGHIFSFLFFKLNAELNLLQNILFNKLTDKELVEKYNNLNKKEQRKTDSKANALGMYFFDNMDSQEGEKFADHFAAYYGYGYELAQGLALFFKINGYMKPEGVLNTLTFDLNLVLTDLLVNNYPNTFNRLNYILNAMKRELKYNKSLTKKQKQELLEKIDNINKLNAELYNTKHSRTPYGFLRNVIYSNKVGQTKDSDNRYNQLLDDYVDKKLF